MIILLGENELFKQTLVKIKVFFDNFKKLCKFGLAMKTNQLNKELIVESITKLVKDKELVRSYIKGQISLQALKDEGIKFGRPL